MRTKKSDQEYSDPDIAKRRDDAIRRALNTPPKPYKDSKVGKGKTKRPHPSDKG